MVFRLPLYFNGGNLFYIQSVVELWRHSEKYFSGKIWQVYQVGWNCFFNCFRFF